MRSLKERAERLANAVSATRKEFQQEADVNVLLQKYGVGVPQRRGAPGGIDFDIDLQRGIAAVEGVQRAYDRSEVLRKRYKTVREFLLAVSDGSVKVEPDPEPEVKPVAPPDGAAGKGA